MTQQTVNTQLSANHVAMMQVPKLFSAGTCSRPFYQDLFKKNLRDCLNVHAEQRWMKGDVTFNDGGWMTSDRLPLASAELSLVSGTASSLALACKAA